jgi:hypothetical protein
MLSLVKMPRGTLKVRNPSMIRVSTSSTLSLIQLRPRRARLKKEEGIDLQT